MATIKFKEQGRNTTDSLNFLNQSFHVDPLNYLAIELLEYLGFYKPDQHQIDSAEEILTLIKKIYIKEYFPN